MDSKIAYVLKVAQSYQDRADEYTRWAVDTIDMEARRARLRAAYDCQIKADLLKEIAHDIEYL